MKNKIKTCDYRMYKTGEIYSVIKVFYSPKGKIVGHTSFLYPVGTSEKDIKIQISDMLKATRQPALTDKDLDGTICYKR